MGKPAVVHLIRDGIYIDIQFTSWGGSGGQVSYVRSARPPLSAQESWRQQFFNTPLNAGPAADDFDFDRDGLVNLIEFAFGLDPTQPGALTLPQPEMMAGNMSFTFTQPAGVSGVIYEAEWSPSIASGSWTHLSDTGSSPTHTFTLPTDNRPKAFVRFLISLP